MNHLKTLTKKRKTIYTGAVIGALIGYIYGTAVIPEIFDFGDFMEFIPDTLSILHIPSYITSLIFYAWGYSRPPYYLNGLFWAPFDALIGAGVAYMVYRKKYLKKNAK